MLVFVTVTVPVAAAAATGTVAFRADPMGVTLGGDPMTWTGRGSSAVFIPWSDVEKRIVIYPAGPGCRLGLGVQRRAGAPPLLHGNQPARRCPVPGVAEGATRQTAAWRLDRERLTALMAAVAPGIPVVEAASVDAGAGDAALEGSGAAPAPSR